MKSLPVTQACSRQNQLLDEASTSHPPIQITGIEETLYLVSIPGLRDSIRKGMAELLHKASTQPGW